MSSDNESDKRPSSPRTNHSPKPSRHLLSSPTSERKPIDEEDVSSSSEEDERSEDDEQEEAASKQPEECYQWPKVPKFITEKKELNVDDEVRVMAYMLGMKVDSLAISRIQHILHTFTSNEKKIHNAFEKRMSIDSSTVTEMMKLRSTMISHLTKMLSVQVAQERINKHNQK